MKLYYENPHELYPPFLIQNITIFLILCCFQPRRERGGYVYSWGKWGNQSDLHDEWSDPQGFELSMFDLSSWALSHFKTRSPTLNSFFTANFLSNHLLIQL